MYALVRQDLGMSPGKTAAQAGHAFLDSYLAAGAGDPLRAAAYLSDPLDGETPSRPHSGTKVALAAGNLDALLRAAYEAKIAGLPCALITDSGHVLPGDFVRGHWHQPFDGRPVVTALGIGPARRAEVRHITDRFALVR